MDAENLQKLVQFGSEICGYERCNSPVFQPSAAHFSWDLLGTLGNHKLDPSLRITPGSDPDPGMIPGLAQPLVGGVLQGSFKKDQ